MPSSQLIQQFAAAFPEQKLQTCVHCGMCLPQCPTYRVLGVETESPRGRLYLMKALAAGELQLSDGFVEHMELCLNCRTCEAVCPSGVKFGGLMETTRAIIQERHPRHAAERLMQSLLLDHVLPHPRRLDAAMFVAKLYQLAAQGALRRVRLLEKVGGVLSAADHMLPKMPARFFKPPKASVVRAVGNPRFRVGFFSGCIMRSMFADVHYATIRVLTINGCDVIVPSNQTCCGAVHVHNGLKRTATALAHRNIDAFKEANVDFIIVNSAGCGATLKEYPELLHQNPAYSREADAFSEKIRDFNEFLAEIDLETRLGRVNKRVTYHDPCHLVHVQKVRVQPRRLLSAIPGVEFVEMKDSDQCCGGAGTYSLFQQDLANRILDAKMDNLAATKAEVVVTSNPPCLIQLRQGVERRALPMTVKHIAQMLDEAYSRHPAFATRFAGP